MSCSRRTARASRSATPQAWLLSPALARLAACGAGLMLVLPVHLPAQQPAAPARAAARTASATAAVVPVAARDLPRGHTLAAADVAPFTSSLVGWTTRRVITAGQPLREPAVAPPATASAVTPGQRVAVLFREAGIELRLAGVAAGAAPLGARVKVRVDPTSRAAQPRRLEGTVVAPGVVQLP